MPLQPKFSELMRRIVIGKFTVRFWFCQDAIRLSSQDADSWVKGFLQSILLIPNYVGELAEVVNLYFPENLLSAYEITDEDGNGVVAYLEWP